MKTLYLDLSMGAAGDMLMAALLELHPQPEKFLQTMRELGIPGVSIDAQKASKCGITGTHVSVLVHGHDEGDSAPAPQPMSEGPYHDHDYDGEPETQHTGGGVFHDHDYDGEPAPKVDEKLLHEMEQALAQSQSISYNHANARDNFHGHTHAHEHDHAHSHDEPHAHRGLHEIEHLLSHLHLSPKVYGDALAVYRLIADAESRVHGQPVDQIHFHEVGNLDAVADIVGVCMLMEALAPHAVLASPVHVGAGTVRCAHGVLPVPAPATALLLTGIPSYGGAIQGELCTPTGAALLKHFVRSFGPMPVMVTEKIGYGMGKKDFEQANCVRAFWGEIAEGAGESPASCNGGSISPADGVIELCCNLDDMTPEAVAFAQERLLELGALDVTVTPLLMKKGRPGVLLSCLAMAEKREALVKAMFLHTSTLGLREVPVTRYKLSRTEEVVETAHGPVRVKVSEGYGVVRRKAEYEDLARIARETGMGLEEARRLVEKR